MDQEKLLKLLKAARDEIVTREIGDYLVVVDKTEMVEMYDEAIYRVETLSNLETAYKNSISNCQNLANENERLHKELKKRRKEKKKWKRRALMYEAGNDSLRKIIKMKEAYNNDNK